MQKQIRKYLRVFVFIMCYYMKSVTQCSDVSADSTESSSLAIVLWLFPVPGKMIQIVVFKFWAIVCYWIQLQRFCKYLQFQLQSICQDDLTWLRRKAEGSTWATQCLLLAFAFNLVSILLTVLRSTQHLLSQTAIISHLNYCSRSSPAFLLQHCLKHSENTQCAYCKPRVCSDPPFVSPSGGNRTYIEISHSFTCFTFWWQSAHIPWHPLLGSAFLPSVS